MGGYQALGKIFVAAGALLLLVGGALLLGTIREDHGQVRFGKTEPGVGRQSDSRPAGKLFAWFGRLPGDIRFEQKGVSVYIPITTSLVLSALLSVLFIFLRHK